MFFLICEEGVLCIGILFYGYWLPVCWGSDWLGSGVQG